MTGPTPDETKRGALVAAIVVVAAGAVALLIFQPPRGASTQTNAPRTSADVMPCVKGATCTVDLSACAATRKAPSWADQTSLHGLVNLASYTSHFDWVCQVSGVSASGQPFHQAWPMRPEPHWWCGTVTPTCVCGASDGCK